MNYFQTDVQFFLGSFLSNNGYIRMENFSSQDFMILFRKELSKDVVCDLIFQCSNFSQKKDNYHFNININRLNKNIHSNIYQNLSGRLNHVLSIIYDIEDYNKILWWNFIRDGENQGIYNEISYLLLNYIFPWLENPNSKDFGRLSIEEEKKIQKTIKKQVQEIMKKNNFIYMDFPQSNVIVYHKKIDELTNAEIRFTFSLNWKLTRKELDVSLTQIKIKEKTEQKIFKDMNFKKLLFFENKLTREEADQEWLFDKESDLVQIFSRINPFIEGFALIWLCDISSLSFNEYMKKINPTIT